MWAAWTECRAPHRSGQAAVTRFHPAEPDPDAARGTARRPRVTTRVLAGGGVSRCVEVRPAPVPTVLDAAPASTSDHRCGSDGFPSHPQVPAPVFLDMEANVGVGDGLRRGTYPARYRPPASSWPPASSRAAATTESGRDRSKVPPVPAATMRRVRFGTTVPRFTVVPRRHPPDRGEGEPRRLGGVRLADVAPAPPSP